MELPGWQCFLKHTHPQRESRARGQVLGGGRLGILKIAKPEGLDALPIGPAGQPRHAAPGTQRGAWTASISCRRSPADPTRPSLSTHASFTQKKSPLARPPKNSPCSLWYQLRRASVDSPWWLQTPLLPLSTDFSFQFIKTKIKSFGSLMCTNHSASGWSYINGIKQSLLPYEHTGILSGTKRTEL